jgi:hypothetical protein
VLETRDESQTYEEIFQLVGECHTHGFMTDDAWTNYTAPIEEVTLV